MKPVESHAGKVPADFFEPNVRLNRQIDQASHSAATMCWTCGSCDFECPVNIATGRLRPQKIVRLACLGLLDELLHLPEIWYCLTCRRCLQVCPNSVKPSALIEFVRRESLNRGIMSVETIKLYNDLFTGFQRIRWHAVNHCFEDDLNFFTDEMWCDWCKPPDLCSKLIIIQDLQTDVTIDVRAAMAESRTRACFTCGECDSACPIFGGPSVFDPRAIFRMINLGMIDELIRSPSLWLCIACGRCTEACSQLVDGRNLIENLKRMAFEKGVVDAAFRIRLEKADKVLYSRFLDEIDLLLLSNVY